MNNHESQTNRTTSPTILFLPASFPPPYLHHRVRVCLSVCFFLCLSLSVSFSVFQSLSLSVSPSYREAASFDDAPGFLVIFEFPEGGSESHALNAAVESLRSDFAARMIRFHAADEHLVRDRKLLHVARRHARRLCSGGRRVGAVSGVEWGRGGVGEGWSGKGVEWGRGEVGKIDVAEEREKVGLIREGGVN